MWRGGLAGGALFVLTGLCWAIHDPLMARYEVSALTERDVDFPAIEKSLLHRGRGAWKSLREGMENSSPLLQRRCARILAFQGDNPAIDYLLKALSDPHGTDMDRAWVEQCLMDVWNQRRAPARADLLRRKFNLSDPSPASLHELDIYLAQYPAWSNGYYLRAHARLDADQPEDARSDALQALRLEPEHFGAILVLGKSLYKLGQYETAQLCLEKAAQADPLFLTPELADLIKDARIKAASDREQRMRLRRLELPRI